MQEATLHCTRCGADNAPSARFCSACGTSLVAADAEGRIEPSLGSASAWQAIPKEPERAGARMSPDLRELYAMAIGDRNQRRYLDKFERFDRAGKTSAGWHWPAFFVTFYWLLYRKMWARAALYFFLPYIVITALAMMASPLGGSAVLLIYGVYLVGLFVLPALFADGVYYRVCKKRIEAILALHDSPEGQRILVAQKGGTSNVALVLVCLLVVPAVVGMLAAIALPAYQDYTARAKTSQALVFGKAASAAVGEFYELNRRLPGTLAEASFVTPLPTVLDNVQFNTSSGVLRLVLASGPMAGRVVQLVPSIDAGGRLLWRCEAGTAEPRYLPMECRR